MVRSSPKEREREIVITYMTSSMTRGWLGVAEYSVGTPPMRILSKDKLCPPEAPPVRSETKVPSKYILAPVLGLDTDLQSTKHT